jgi:hypothetical protein
LMNQRQVISESLHLTSENRHVDFRTKCSDRDIEH